MKSISAPDQDRALGVVRRFFEESPFSPDQYKYQVARSEDEDYTVQSKDVLEIWDKYARLVLDTLLEPDRLDRLYRMTQLGEGRRGAVGKVLRNMTDFIVGDFNLTVSNVSNASASSENKTAAVPSVPARLRRSPTTWAVAMYYLSALKKMSTVSTATSGTKDTTLPTSFVRFSCQSELQRVQGLLKSSQPSVWDM